jgi:hypothetical protein
MPCWGEGVVRGADREKKKGASELKGLGSQPEKEYFSTVTVSFCSSVCLNYDGETQL